MVPLIREETVPWVVRGGGAIELGRGSSWGICDVVHAISAIVNKSFHSENAIEDAQSFVKLNHHLALLGLPV